MARSPDHNNCLTRGLPSLGWIQMLSRSLLQIISTILVLTRSNLRRKLDVPEDPARQDLSIRP